MPDPTPDTRHPNPDLERELAEARATIAALERRQRIDDLLRDADTIDLDAARLLTELAVTQMDEPDVAAAVADLRRHKPYLFRPTPPTGGMPARHDDAAVDHTDEAAREAATSGDRRDLLRYLRLKRSSSRRG